VFSAVKRGFLAMSMPLAMLHLAGCASTGGIGPSSKINSLEKLDVGEAIRAAAAEAQWPRADWWRSYNDPQLDAWIETSLIANPTLLVAQARVRKARAASGIARAAQLPQVNADIQVKREHWPDNVYYGPGPLADQDTWNDTASIDFSYHLDLWGKDKSVLRGALDVAHAQAVDYRAAQLELTSNIVVAYIDLSLNYTLLDVARDTLDRQEQVLALAYRRFRGGIGTQIEIAQAEATIPESRRRVESVEESIDLGRIQLAALAGRSPGEGETIKRPRLVLTENEGLPTSVPAELIGHRPDVVAAKWTVAAQARNIDAAKADFYPNVNLLVSIGGFAAAGPLFQFLKSPSQSWTGGPALSLPLFTGGRLRSQLDSASADYDAAVETYNQTIVQALKEISDQVTRIRSLDRQKNDAQLSLSTANKSYVLAQESYKRGLTDYVNVLVAQTQLLRAQEGVARVDADRLAARARLNVALGGGLIDPEEGPNGSETLPATSDWFRSSAHGAARRLSRDAEEAATTRSSSATSSLPLSLVRRPQ
jgi:NodT family efflux transporter outer membrane factor (OMF) lipoprotein